MTAATHAFRLALLTSAGVVASSCGGGGSGSSAAAPPPAAANVTTMVIDGGPVVNGSPTGTVNQAYVTITVCVPGTTTCQAIDHVWVDTGSSGLRLMASAFTPQLPVATQGGNNVGNCGQFLASYTWGAVRTADVKIGGELASSVPIQVIGDTAVPATAPANCSNGSQAQTLGANGLLGIGVFLQDCGSGCSSTAAPGFYYTCPGGTCQPVSMTTNLQLQNVVGLFTTDNNGVLIQLPALSAAGAPTASGSLIFGIGTQSNNALGSAMVFAADPNGNIHTTTTYGDLSEPASFVDSGSNGFFFNDALTACSGNSAGFYCPASTASLSATMLPFNSSSGFTYNFSIADANNLSGDAFNNLGGPGSTCDNTTVPCSFDWGLPFFFGRNVFTALEGTTISGNAGPFFAASTP